MANASVRLLTQGWTGAKRRALVAALDDRQHTMVRDRIILERATGRFEADDAADALQFLATNGIEGYSCGVVEWVAAVLFGGDPAFRESWRAIRTSEERTDGSPDAESGLTATNISPSVDVRGRASRAPEDMP